MHEPSPVTASDVLSNIESSLPSMSDKEKRKLWSVLTALRGPDDGDDAIKAYTTAVIRRHSLPTLANIAGAMVAGCTWCDNGSEAPEMRLSDVHMVKLSKKDHFLDHLADAADALGIPMIREVNGDAREPGNRTETREWLMRSGLVGVRGV